jgi:uncharacterized low-complexity protein
MLLFKGFNIIEKTIRVLNKTNIRMHLCIIAYKDSDIWVVYIFIYDTKLACVCQYNIYLKNINNPQTKKNMKNKKTILSGSVIASAILAVSGTNVGATSLTDFNTLGSGSEVRSNLLGNPADAINAFELACGEKKDAKGAEAKCGEGKAKDAKCGEHKTDDKAKDAKCGEHKTEGKAKDAKCGEHKTDDKAKEAKCGEHKCGDHKSDGTHK